MNTTFDLTLICRGWDAHILFFGQGVGDACCILGCNFMLFSNGSYMASLLNAGRTFTFEYVNHVSIHVFIVYMLLQVWHSDSLSGSPWRFSPSDIKACCGGLFIEGRNLSSPPHVIPFTLGGCTILNMYEYMRVHRGWGFMALT